MRGKPGRAWATIRQSEPAALAAGVNISLYKMWAFALASFMTGIAGALLASSSGTLYNLTFPTQDSIILLAVVLMGGIYSLWGAVVAGILIKLLPALLDNWGLPPDLLDDPLRHRRDPGSDHGAGGPGRPVPEGHGEAGALSLATCGKPGGAGCRRHGGVGMIKVENLEVRFGGVKPIDQMTVTFPKGTCGLIGPNGAGKTTFFNVLSGFVKPSAGTVTAFDENLLAMTDFRRARWGLRRTFQTEQAIEELSLYDNVAMVEEHSKNNGGTSRRDDVLGSLAFVGLGDLDPNKKVGTLGARERRLVEIARAVVGKPRAVLLDEPAAGLPDEETEHMGSVIRRIPDEIGALVILVDHDMSLVSACCELTSVLDFGKLIASGPTDEVLRDEQVIRAYLGAEEL